MGPDNECSMAEVCLAVVFPCCAVSTGCAGALGARTTTHGHGCV